MSYSRVDEEDGTSSDSEGFSERKHFLGDGKLDVSRPISGQGKVWIVSTFILLFLLGLVGSFELWIRVLSRRESYEAGFQTELGPARNIIQKKRVAFTGNLNFFDNATTYLEHDAGSAAYVGRPSKEIDDNWERLLRGRYFYLSESEVISSWGSSALEEYTYITPNSGERRYIGGLDILHTLHCVEQLRQTLDRDYYPQAKKAGSLHLYHCIDHIRQMIMCSGDLTPIPTRYHEGKGRSYVDTDQVHTCRNFDAIWDWVQERDYVRSEDLMA